MAENGRFADSDLVVVPEGRLAREAAANWLALRAEGSEKLGILITPAGPRSSYRTYDDQVTFWNIYQAGGNLAARPGTSNHGWGNAVDLKDPPSMRKVVDQFGAAYGWHWGEAPSESWHVTYRGGGKADPNNIEIDTHPTLEVGDKGDAVMRMQQWLHDNGYPEVTPDGDFGPMTEKAVNKLMRSWGHAGRGKFGDAGWSIIEGKHPWRVLRDDERDAMAALFRARRGARKAGGFDKVEAADRETAIQHMGFLIARRKDLWRKGKAEGWKTERRRKRYQIIKKVTTDGAGP
jgi:putative peptidoglycan binding protein/D-alanyl-D-alanine carboxypeptidase-like protein